MKVNITWAPEGASFEAELPYLVYGASNQLRFVFDDKGDSYFLYELVFVKVND